MGLRLKRRPDKDYLLDKIRIVGKCCPLLGIVPFSIEVGGEKRKFLFLGDGPLGREYEVHVVNCAGWVHNNSWNDNVHLWEMTWEWGELQS